MGDDDVRGDRGRDQVLVGPGNDRVWGGRGDDTLNGGSGRDRMFGGAVADVLVGCERVVTQLALEMQRSRTRCAGPAAAVSVGQ